VKGIVKKQKKYESISRFGEAWELTYESHRDQTPKAEEDKITVLFA